MRAGNPGWYAFSHSSAGDTDQCQGCKRRQFEPYLKRSFTSHCTELEPCSTIFLHVNRRAEGPPKPETRTCIGPQRSALVCLFMIVKLYNNSMRHSDCTTSHISCCEIKHYWLVLLMIGIRHNSCQLIVACVCTFNFYFILVFMTTGRRPYLIAVEEHVEYILYHPRPNPKLPTLMSSSTP